MKKNPFNPLSICFLFLFAVLFILTPFKTAKAYGVGQIVDYHIEEGVFCNTNCSPASPFIVNGDWYGAPDRYERWGTSPGYSWEIEKHVITAASGCKVIGCGTPNQKDNPVTCELIQSALYEAEQHSPVWPYWNIYGYSLAELCIKCYQEIEETIFEGSNYKSIRRELVDKNECSKFLSGDCDNDPCSGLTCPPMKCEILDANKTGRGEGYKCVAATTATTASASGGTSVADRGAILGATLTDWHSKYLCECEKEVTAGKKTWCPSNKKGGCCPTEKPVCCSAENVPPDHPGKDASSKASMCCDKGFECGYSKFKQTFYCQAGNDCPADYPKKCAGDPSNPDPKIIDVPTCCKNEQSCEFYMTTIGNTRVHYCGSGGDKCDDSTDPGFCAKGVCCKSYETCTNSIGIYWCNATGEKECTDAGGTYCEGHVTPAVNLCCTGETPNCYVNPNGVPSCY